MRVYVRGKPGGAAGHAPTFEKMPCPRFLHNCDSLERFRAENPFCLLCATVVHFWFQAWLTAKCGILSGAVHIVHVAAFCAEIAQSEKKQET